MKNYIKRSSWYALLLAILLSSFSLYADETIIDEDDFTEEEFAILDSLRLLYENSTAASRDSVNRAIRAKKRQQALVNFTHRSTYYIQRNTAKTNYIYNVLILCDEYTYQQLQPEIIRYAQDIHNVYGCGITISALFGGTSIDVKQLIKDYYNTSSLSGVVLIGDIPTEHFELAGEEESWPCDLYYMDLNGVWSDKNGNDIYDDHTGNTAPEIFVGRICANGFDNRYVRLKEYFDRNHLFWIGGIPLNKQKALSVTGPDWTKHSQFRSGIRCLYGSTYTDKAEGNNFSKTDYITYIQNRNYEFIQLACHSDSLYHAFKKDRSQNLTARQLGTIHKQTIGYNLFCCKACNWNRRGCLGESYLYSPSNALVVIGSTKSGGMLGFNEFYKPLGENECIGVAYKQWWNKYGSIKLEKQERISWWYGMCILGDPFIQFKYDNQCNSTQNISSWNNRNTSNIHLYSASDEISVSCSIPEEKGLILKANSIVLEPGFHATEGTTFQASVDPCYQRTSPRKVMTKEDHNNATISGTDSVSMILHNDGIPLYQNHIQAVPNPCATVFSVVGLLADKFSYKIYNMRGELTICGLTSDTRIDVSMLPKGTYIVQIEGNAVYDTQTIKLIIQ